MICLALGNSPFLLVTEIDSPLILQKSLHFYVTDEIILSDVLRPSENGAQHHSKEFYCPSSQPADATLTGNTRKTTGDPTRAHTAPSHLHTLR